MNKIKNQKITIREAKLSEFKKLYSEILNKPDRDAYNEKLVRELISEKFSICLVAEENKKIVGVLGARREGYKAYWLYFLHPKKKSDKLVESLLMDEFFKIAKKLGANKVACDTPYVKLLKKFDFKEVGRLPKWQADGKDQIILFRKI